MRAAFTFAPGLCTGCEACRVACGNENAGGRDTGWRQVVTFNPERHPALPTLHLSLACNHCEVPACAKGCPARAYRRDPATGAVLIDEAKCIGCRYCSWVCPYDAPRFDEGRGVMTKCTFCVQRLEAGLEPACVAACPTGALGLGERRVPATEPAFHGLGRWGLGPALTIVAPGRMAAPEGLIPDDAAELSRSASGPGSSITLASEKGLVAFTLMIPALAAWFAAGLRIPGRAPGLGPFLAIAALALAFATAHLGRPGRAWRALLGLATSWLSREVAATVAFVTLGAVSLLPQAPPAVGFAALASAALAVLAMDGVYLSIPRTGAPRFHGAETTTAFLMLAGIAADLPPLAAAAATVKVLLMVVRSRHGMLGMPPSLAVLRAALLAAALTDLPGSGGWAPSFLLALASEAIDRAAFYGALDPSTPAARMHAELREALLSGEAPPHPRNPAAPGTTRAAARG